MLIAFGNEEVGGYWAPVSTYAGSVSFSLPGAFCPFSLKLASAAAVARILVRKLGTRRCHPPAFRQSSTARQPNRFQVLLLSVCVAPRRGKFPIWNSTVEREQ